MFWHTTRFCIDLRRPQVMGIVNVTPDSFSDGGQHGQTRSALAHCECLIEEGADILDIGGESTRPGSQPVPLDQELARVLPVVRAAVTLGVPVSVDTFKPQVMQAVLDLGADIVNDIWALRLADAQDVVANHGSCGVCLMHMHREPISMQARPMEGDAVAQVHAFLAERVDMLQARGVSAKRIAVDPGIGFGKTVSQNFGLLGRQAEAVPFGFPILAGWSRKSSLGMVTGRAVGHRMVPSVTAAVLAVDRGARIVRVHDVSDTVAALAVWKAMQDASTEQPGNFV